MTMKEIVAENSEFEILQHRFAAMIQRLDTENKKMLESQAKLAV
jgi:hypothetical protein